MGKRLKEIAEEIRKTGELTPASVYVGGTLRPEQSSRWINLIVSKSNILSMVTVDKSSKLKKDINVREFITGVLQRVPQGTEPSEYTKYTNVGKQLDMLDAQLFAQITLDYLRDNQDKPTLENDTAAYLADVYARDIVKLAFTGIADDFSLSDATKKLFTHLNKGWPALLKESIASHKVDINDYITSGVVGWANFLSAVVTALPEIYKSDSCRILMNKADYEEYCTQIGNMNGAVNLLISGQIKQYLGYEIIPVLNMPSKTVIFTPMANLVYGVNTNAERYRELSGTKRAIDYTYDSSFDFQVAVDDAAVIGYTVPVTAPSITSTLTASGTVGTAFTYTISGTNMTDATFAASDLPSGLSVDTSTGVISGTPASGTDGTHNVTISATKSGESDSKTLVITIAAA